MTERQIAAAFAEGSKYAHRLLMLARFYASGEGRRDPTERDMEAAMYWMASRMSYPPAGVSWDELDELIDRRASTLANPNKETT